MLKDGLDHFLVFDEADDPHGPLSFRADQGIYFVYLLNQPGPTFPEGLFVSLRFEDAGDGITNFQGSVNIATLDMDATLIASGKESVLYCYQRYQAYQPQNTWWAEQGIVLHTEFRDGNVPAGFEQLRVLKQALGWSARRDRKGPVAFGYGRLSARPFEILCNRREQPFWCNRVCDRV